MKKVFRSLFDNFEKDISFVQKVMYHGEGSFVSFSCFSVPMWTERLLSERILTWLLVSVQ